MELDKCIKKINKYLTLYSGKPLLVDVQNSDDLEKIIMHFDVGENNIILDASKFCNQDELPRMETLLATISSEKKNCFLIGSTSFLRFCGEERLKIFLKDIINLYISGHVIVITYQCQQLLNFSDSRLTSRIVICDGDTTPFPKLIFISKDLPLPSVACTVDGINKVAEKIERTNCSSIYIITSKSKDLYNRSVYFISHIDKAYEIIIDKDNTLNLLDEDLGTDDQWKYLLKLLNNGKKFAELLDEKFGSHQNLEIAIHSYLNLSDELKWLFFIGLKLFGSRNNEYLTFSIKNTKNYSELIRDIFRGILSYGHNDKDFKKIYEERKKLLIDLKNPLNEVIDYCKFVLQKEENTIYYLTDNTYQEKELIITLIERYYQNTDKDKLEKILSMVYADLYFYMKDYKFDKLLLDEYFSLYKHSKVINKVLPKLEELMSKQAKLREYNLLLQPRTAEIDKINKDNSQLYFMDAMGIEYLSYIIANCKKRKLMAKITVCTANLPSITSKNKEFIDEFKNKKITINSEKRLDQIKHHGLYDYDYTKKKQPFHLIKELEIIDDILEEISLNLAQDVYKKAIMVSDHGASRLAVIHETENMWEMVSKGEHSGRCCPKSDADIRPPFATEEDGFWVLANYDRFKGGRKANVEVHGGATLEEVVVPIIEITKIDEDIEITIPEKIITVSFKKKAAIKLFSKTELEDVSVCIEGIFYKAEKLNKNIYLVNMPHLKKARQYSADVYVSNNLVVSGLIFEIKKEIFQEKDLL